MEARHRAALIEDELVDGNMLLREDACGRESSSSTTAELMVEAERILRNGGLRYDRGNVSLLARIVLVQQDEELMSITEDEEALMLDAWQENENGEGRGMMHDNENDTMLMTGASRGRRGGWSRRTEVERNLAVLQGYLLYPEDFDFNVCSAILAQGLSRGLWESEFAQYSVLIPEIRAEDLRLAPLLMFGDLLQSCRFRTAWTLLFEAPADSPLGLLRRKRGLVARLRRFIADVISLSYVCLSVHDAMVLLHFSHLASFLPFCRQVGWVACTPSTSGGKDVLLFLPNDYHAYDAGGNNDEAVLDQDRYLQPLNNNGNQQQRVFPMTSVRRQVQKHVRGENSIEEKIDLSQEVATFVLPSQAIPVKYAQAMQEEGGIVIVSKKLEEHHRTAVSAGTSTAINANAVGDSVTTISSGSGISNVAKVHPSMSTVSNFMSGITGPIFLNNHDNFRSNVSLSSFPYSSVLAYFSTSAAVAATNVNLSHSQRIVDKHLSTDNIKMCFSTLQR